MVRIDETSHLRIGEESLRWTTVNTDRQYVFYHRLENTEIQYEQYIRGISRLQKLLDHSLQKGNGIVVQRYKDRCKKLRTHRQSLWLFLIDNSIPLTNNEGERRIRGSVIQRKISFETTSDAVNKFRDRMYAFVGTCNRRGMSGLSVLAKIVQAVTLHKPYPNVFNL